MPSLSKKRFFYSPGGFVAVLRVHMAESTYARNPASYTGFLGIGFPSNFSFGKFGGLLQAKVEGPEEKSGGPTVSIALHAKSYLIDEGFTTLTFPCISC